MNRSPSLTSHSHHTLSPILHHPQPLYPTNPPPPRPPNPSFPMSPLTPLLLPLLLLLTPTTLANGCHTSKDKIGCPTVISTDTFTSAIAAFCNNHFIRLNQPPLTQSIAVGNSWPGQVYSLPTYEDKWGSMVMFWGEFVLCCDVFICSVHSLQIAPNKKSFLTHVCVCVGKSYAKPCSSSHV
ncbi:hypothetical protein BDR22DRAFT_208453 [Usnea florida]